MRRLAALRSFYILFGTTAFHMYCPYVVDGHFFPSGLKKKLSIFAANLSNLIKPKKAVAQMQAGERLELLHRTAGLGPNIGHLAG